MTYEVAEISCRQSIWMREQKIKDYVALWRYIASLMGTPTEFFETPEKAKSMKEILLFYEIKPTATSRILANNVIRCLEPTTKLCYKPIPGS